MMRRILAALLAAAIPAAAALAQNVYVDFNRSTGPGAGGPPSTYGAASGRTGLWNTVTPSTEQQAVMLQSTDLGHGIVLWHRASMGERSAAYGSGDFSNLMADYAYGYAQNGVVEMTFSGLMPGFYSVYVYAGLPQSEAYYELNGQTHAHTCYIGVYSGSTFVASGTTSGWVGGNVFQEGVNYREFQAGVPQGGSLRIVATADLTYFGAKIAINGVQLVRWPNARVHVTPTGAGRGSSWADATNLHNALDMVNRSRGALQTVWLAEGTYKPSLNDRTRFFHLTDSASLIGGFAGHESSQDERTPGRETVLSGNIGNVFSHADNSYTVLRADGDRLYLKSLTVRDGRANGPAAGEHNIAGGLVARCYEVTLRNCTFENNAGATAGAVHVHELGSVWATDTLAEFCVFKGNTTSGSGGAISHSGPWNARMIVRDCRFQGNSAGVRGGALHMNGLEYTVIGSLFNGNHAGEGGAVYCEPGASNSEFTMKHCTVTNNSASTFVGGVAAAAHDVRVYGSILWANTATLAPIPAFRQLGTGLDSTTRVYFSCVLGHTNQFAGEGVTGANPRFVSLFGADNIPGTEDDDLRLSDDSPLIDAGWETTQLLDLDGRPRRVDNLAVLNTGNVGPGPGALPAYTDMGCFENQSTGAPPPCAADWNGDGLVNSSDISAFITAWLGSLQQGTLVADFNGDGTVNSSDISAFITAWLAAVSGGGC